MSYRVRLIKHAAKFYQQLSPSDQARVAKGLDSLAADPWVGKKLQGIFVGYYVIRVRPFRIIYSIRKHECLVIVIRIGKRKDVYNG